MSKRHYLRNNAPLILLVLMLFLCLAIILVASSCSKTKNVQQTKETEKEKFDSSSYYRNLFQKSIDSIDFLKSELKKSQISDVEFNSDNPCDSQTLKDIVSVTGCNVDSIKKALDRRYMNKIKILADGTVELQGNIKSYKSLTSIIENSLKLTQKKLTESLDSVSYYKKYYEIEKTKSSKNKQVKTKFGYSLLWYVLVIIIWTMLWERYIKGFGYSIINKFRKNEITKKL